MAIVDGKFIIKMIEEARAKEPTLNDPSGVMGYEAWESVLDDMMSEAILCDKFKVCEKEPNVFVARSGTMSVKFDAAQEIIFDRPALISAKVSNRSGKFKLWSIAPNAGESISAAFKEVLANHEMEMIMDCCKPGKGVSSRVL